MSAEVASISLASIGAFIAVVLVATGIGVSLGIRASRKLGHIPQGESGLRHLRTVLRRNRQRRREVLTRGERIVAGTVVLTSSLLAPVGVIILLIAGSGLRPVGIALLLLALIVMAIPIGPVLQARVRRRERLGGRDGRKPTME